MNAPVQCLAPRDAGHVFRSKLIDILARLEKWTVETLRAAPPDPLGKKVKVPLLLGKRLDRVRVLLTSHPTLFRSAQETTTLLKRLEPYIKLRTTLVHGQMVTSNIKGATLYLFDNPIADADLTWTRRAGVRSTEIDKILEDAGALVDQIIAQARVPDANPSSPPPPRPAATAGP